MAWKKVEKFGSRCSMCGAHFEDDICSSGHLLGDFVEVTKPKKEEKNIKIKKKQK